MRPPSVNAVVYLLNLLSLTTLYSSCRDGNAVRAAAVSAVSSGSSSSTPRSVVVSSAARTGGAVPPRVNTGTMTAAAGAPNANPGGPGSARKWRAARRQMLRRVFMLLSSPGDGDDLMPEQQRRVVRGSDSPATVPASRKTGSGGRSVAAKAVRVHRSTLSPNAVAVSSVGGGGVGATSNDGGGNSKKEEGDINIGINQLLMVGYFRDL